MKLSGADSRSNQRGKGTVRAKFPEDQSVVADVAPHLPALVVANAAYEILFATPNARTWLRTFFPKHVPEMLPARIARWLQSGSAAPRSGISARRSGSHLFVTRCTPEPGECIALLLQPIDNGKRLRAGGETLSRRQQDVLRWIASGKSNKAIAATLKISPKTVSKHVENVFRKLGVTSRIAAANAYTGYVGAGH